MLLTQRQLYPISLCSRTREQHRRRICKKQITCSEQVIEGDENTIFGDNNIILGNRNHVYGKGNTVMGQGNYIRGKDNYAEKGNIVISENESSSSSSNNENMGTNLFNTELLNFFNTNVSTLFNLPITSTGRRQQQLPNLFTTTTAARHRRESLQREERDKRIRKSRKGNSSLKPEHDKKAEPHESSCLICFENVPCTMFEPCNHICCCATCSLQSEDCPLCNEKHDGVKQVVFAGREPEAPIKK